MPKKSADARPQKKLAQKQTEVAAVFLDPKLLKPWPENPRENDAAVPRVAEAIRRFGFGAPIVARAADKMIIAGHTRWKASLLLELQRVPVRLMDIGAREAHLMALTDNRLNEISPWSLPDLHATLGTFDAADIQLAGWSDKEFQAMAAKLVNFSNSKEVDLEAIESEKFAHKCPKCGCEFNDRGPRKPMQAGLAARADT